MNKIKEKLIHWLGGVTKEEHNKWLEYKFGYGMLYANDDGIMTYFDNRDNDIIGKWTEKE